jgi:hypothetical protein
LEIHRPMIESFLDDKKSSDEKKDEELSGYKIKL